MSSDTYRRHNRAPAAFNGGLPGFALKRRRVGVVRRCMTVLGHERSAAVPTIHRGVLDTTDHAHRIIRSPGANLMTYRQHVAVRWIEFDATGSEHTSQSAASNVCSGHWMLWDWLRTARSVGQLVSVAARVRCKLSSTDIECIVLSVFRCSCETWIGRELYSIRCLPLAGCYCIACCTPWSDLSVKVIFWKYWIWKVI